MKPIIFFSHCTDDREAILPIRNRLVAGTGNAIEVFMSSDGASIPFGRNWLKQIEDALGHCKLMFVWLTPASVGSSWIPFESGYAYSKGIRVVPIGFQGIKLDQLPAPLGMLQGFNVASAASLNNIVAIINEEFRMTFPDLFDDAFYTTHVEDTTSEDSPELLRFVGNINCNLPRTIRTDDKTTIELRSSWFEILKSIFVESGTSFAEVNHELVGIGFRVRSAQTDNKTWPVINIDPLALNSTWKLWAMARSRLYEGDLPYTVFIAQLVPNLKLPSDKSMIGSRLLRSDVSFDTKVPHVLYRFHNIDFRIEIESFRGEQKREIILLVPPDNADPIPLLSLLRLLEERHIIQKR